MTPTTAVRVRFAPSPTGYLHVGGLRTALYNFLFARRHGGTFILRIEDTDQSRKVEGAAENLIAMLDWAGIQFDEGPGRDGGHGPYVQSSRLSIYHEHVRDLVKAEKAYPCFCSPERLDEVRKKQAAQKLTTSYDRHCRDISANESARRVAAGEPHVVRMKIPLEGELSMDDLVRGTVTFSYKVLDDQVLLKSDGFPTYHLAVVVDDHLMNISHVIRGEEWLSSTPKHVLLYRAFGWELPAFAHLPLLLNADRSKLSKRQGDVAVEEYRKKGYLPDAMVNFVAMLGWNPGDEREVFTLQELEKEFSLERVGKSGAIFNVEKLDWLNIQHLKRTPDNELLRMVRFAWDAAGKPSADFSDDHLRRVIVAMRDRVTFARDFIDRCPYFYSPPEGYEPETVKKRWTPETPDRLRKLAAEFGGLRNPGKEDFEAALHRTAESLGLKASDLIHPVRLAVSGVGAGPGLFDILFILGNDESIRRITTAIQKLS